MEISTTQKKRPDKFLLRPLSILKSISTAHLIMLLLIGGAAVGTSGCKAKKEARAAAAAKAERIAEARADLLAIINDNGSMSLDEKERELNRIKAMNIDDAEIQDLIARTEAIVSRERDAADRVSNSSGGGNMKTEDMNTQLQNVFDKVSSSRSTSDANMSIREALSMFASPETPVLIIISQSGDNIDYDEPTTIKKYLEYLKDTNNQPAAVHNLEVDANGKIKEVELKKNY